MSTRPGQPAVEVKAADFTLLQRVVSLRDPHPTVGSLLIAIERQTDLRFGFSRDVVPVERAVTLRADSITVGAALLSILMDTGVDVILSPDGKIALARRAVNGVIVGRAARGTLVGRITDAKTGHGLAGADVALEKARRRAATDSGGRYRLEADSAADVLTVRRLGYTKHSQPVTIRDRLTDTVNVAMTATVVKLDELVTTSTGLQRRRDIGNAISTIKVDSVLRTAPARNLTDLLANRVPGLTIQHTSGAPGDPAKLRLRGLNSVTGHNDPVVVVDGVRIYAAQTDPRSGNLTNLDPSRTGLAPGNVPAPSPLDQIDPNTIDKIEVFKGPSAATLYGPDAANGVIVVTTKRGRPGPTRWNATLTHGTTTTAGAWPEGYYRFGTSAFGGTTLCGITDLDCKFDSLVRYQALNDPDVTVLGRGHLNDLSLTASGGNQALTYSLTGTYGTETGLLKLPGIEVDRFRTQFDREPPDWMRRPHQLTNWSVRSSVTATLGQTADVMLSTSLARSEQQRSTLEDRVTALAGTYVDRSRGRYYAPIHGGAVPFGSDFGMAPVTNYIEEFYKRTTASSISLTTNLAANWRPRTWFNATGQAGINIVPRDDQLLVPQGLLPVIDEGTTTDSTAYSGQFVRGTGRSTEGTFSLQGNLRKPIGHGFVFTTNIGANVVSRNTADLIGSGVGLAPGTSSLAGARRLSVTESRTSSSVFGWYIEPRIGGERFSLSTGVRLDGGNTYGTRLSTSGSGSVAGRGFLARLLALPKLNGSWVISEEPFFPFKSLFSSLRLRGAYGQSQVQPGMADRLRIYTGDQQLAVTGVGNPDLRPERSVEAEWGFDADVLDSRVSLELTGYRKSEKDALMSVALPSSVNGGGSVMQNIGNIRNAGMEGSLTVTAVQSPALTWSASANYSRNTNTLMKLGRGVLPNPRQGLVEGYPLYGRWSSPILGFADQNGDGVLERNEVQVGDSLVFMGRLLPDYSMSFFSNLAVFGGAVTVSAGFSYDAGATQIDETIGKNWVLVRALSDPSASFGEQAAVVAIDTTSYGLTEDVSTFRFSTFSLNYRVPKRVAALVRAQDLTVALQGSNLGLHSSYRGKDPDVNSWSPSENVVDTGQLPMPRTWQLTFFLRY